MIACNGTIVADSEMGEVIQLQGDQRKDVQEFLVAKDGLELDAKTIKVSGPCNFCLASRNTNMLYRSMVSRRLVLCPMLSCPMIEDRWRLSLAGHTFP